MHVCHAVHGACLVYTTIITLCMCCIISISIHQQLCVNVTEKKSVLLLINRTVERYRYPGFNIYNN